MKPRQTPESSGPPETQKDLLRKLLDGPQSYLIATTLGAQDPKLGIMRYLDITYRDEVKLQKLFEDEVVVSGIKKEDAGAITGAIKNHVRELIKNGSIADEITGREYIKGLYEKFKEEIASEENRKNYIDNEKDKTEAHINTVMNAYETQSRNDNKLNPAKPKAPEALEATEAQLGRLRQLTQSLAEKYQKSENTLRKRVGDLLRTALNRLKTSDPVQKQTEELKAALTEARSMSGDPEISWQITETIGQQLLTRKRANAAVQASPRVHSLSSVSMFSHLETRKRRGEGQDLTPPNPTNKPLP